MSSHPSSPIQLSPYERLRLEPDDRIAVMSLLGITVGALLGGFLGGQHSGRQYLAERAHRLPNTVQGWFFYQKWKNYRVVLGAMKGSVRYGAKVGGCVLAYALVEAAVDRALGGAQIGGSLVAGLATAVGVGRIARLPRSSAGRARLAGLGVGMLTGATQDAVHWRAGRPPAYLVWAQQKKNELIK
ncbi:hypothetical protein LPJ66_000134 [Kickxella alabastrina]|uniref:Uncharacterized protein n=1 Tax=Kickxella alabastrina TaxID=61397 RepID=A0ACC1IWU9_9FUNG|nr:hypothetical protein LPJ66_000134 [Kickxella alabastrina]